MSNKAKFLFLGLGLFAGLTSCQISTERDFSRVFPDQSSNVEAPNEEIKKINPRTDNRYNLTEDREKFDKLRSEVPDKTKTTNDEKALVLSWMQDFKKEPSDIRDKYNSLVRKKRDKFNDDMQKIREEFAKQEKKRREDFLKDLDNARSEIKEKKLNREKSAELYTEIENKRKEFFSKERDQREDFETDYRQKRKDFEDYLKEKSDEFNFELKGYSDKFNDLKKMQN